ncbi:MAG: hypothetical protein WBG43_02380 [Marinifilaceae bacterium]
MIRQEVSKSRGNEKASVIPSARKGRILARKIFLDRKEENIFTLFVSNLRKELVFSK